LEVIHLTKQLTEFFWENKYFAIATTDITIGVLAGLNYVSLWDHNGINLNESILLVEQYQGDLLIASTDVSRRTDKFSAISYYNSEIDIKVLIIDDTITFEEFRNYITDNEAIIILSVAATFPELPNNCKVFNVLEPNYLLKLGRYLINYLGGE